MLNGGCDSESDEAKRRCAGILRARLRCVGHIARVTLEKALGFIVAVCHFRLGSSKW